MDEAKKEDWVLIDAEKFANDMAKFEWEQRTKDVADSVLYITEMRVSPGGIGIEEITEVSPQYATLLFDIKTMWYNLLMEYRKTDEDE